MHILNGMAQFCFPVKQGSLTSNNDFALLTCNILLPLQEVVVGDINRGRECSISSKLIMWCK